MEQWDVQDSFHRLQGASPTHLRAGLPTPENIPPASLYLPPAPRNSCTCRTITWKQINLIRTLLRANHHLSPDLQSPWPKCCTFDERKKLEICSIIALIPMAKVEDYNAIISLSVLHLYRLLRYPSFCWGTSRRTQGNLGITGLFNLPFL